MTKEEVMKLIIVIRAYYPTKKILDNELEVLIWEDEFSNLDYELSLNATRQLCRENESEWDISIASIKNKYKKLWEIKKREETPKLERREITEEDKQKGLKILVEARKELGV